MKPEIIIITGLSGSGKTVALRAIEDSGYFCVDNLPPQLIESFARTVTERGDVRKIAVGIDAREKDFLPTFVSLIQPLRERYDVSVVFLEAEADTLLRRFKETRRPHPLMAPDKAVDIQKAILLEKEILAPLRELSDRIIDTSSFTPHQLREHIISVFGCRASTDGVNVTILSFGFKFGVPQNIDLLFDVRFLPNPHFVPELKDLTGLDVKVRDFVLEKPHAKEFIRKLAEMLAFLVPLYKKEGKSYLTIGIGCTGGRHRSPAIAEEAATLIRKEAQNLNVVHRDI